MGPVTSPHLEAAFAGRRAVVTGARGFIGGRLARALAALGAQVVGFDRLPGGPGSDNLAFRCGTLADPAALGEALEDAGVIFHLAAVAGHRESMERPLADFEGNVIGTLRLLAAAAERAPAARIVFAGTRQLYGSARSLPVREDHPVAPPDVHAVHKEAAEHLGRRLAGGRRIPFSVLRLTNTYGPGQPTVGPGAGFAGNFLDRALAGDEIVILGNPALRRDLNHVDDVVDAFLRAGAAGAPAGTWNLGAPPTTLGDFAAAIFRALGMPPRIRVKPLPAGLASIAVGDFHSDWSAIRADLGWAPRVGLPSGLTGTVRSFRAIRAER